MYWPHFILLASDAALAALFGGGFLMLSVLGWAGDRRRMRRKHIDDVGWMPWSNLSTLSAMAAIVLLAIAGAGWLKG
jgi:hypothetical protein